MTTNTTPADTYRDYLRKRCDAGSIRQIEADMDAVATSSPIFTSTARDNSDLDAELAAGKAALAIFNGDRKTALADLREAEGHILAAMAMDEKLSGGDLR